MKRELKFTILILTMIVASGSSVLAGSWTHTLSTSGTYSANVTLPNAGDCYQYAESNVEGNGTLNYGPLGDISVTNYNDEELSGPVSAGTYGVYQSVSQPDGGVSITTFSW